MIDLVALRNLATVLIALFTALFCFAYALTDQRRAAKKLIYAVIGFGFLYYVVAYTIGNYIGKTTGFYYLLRSGWLGAWGFWALSLAFIAIIITDWRRNDRN